MAKKFEIEHLAKEAIWEKAEQARSELGEIGKAIPIDILHIVEFVLGLDIVPRVGLKNEEGCDAYLSTDVAEIVIDHEMYMAEEHSARYRRARFSVAHEIGHYFLHRNILTSIGSLTEENWKVFQSNILTRQQCGWLEYQAFEFAGRLMVPRTELVNSIRETKFQDKLKGHTLSDDNLARGLANWIADRFHLSWEVLSRRIISEGVLHDFR